MRQFTVTLALLLFLTALAAVPTLIPRSAPHPTEPVPVASPSVTGRTWGLAAPGRAMPALHSEWTAGRVEQHAYPVKPGDADNASGTAAVHSAAKGSIAEPIIGGRASWVRASLGTRYLAMRLPKGTLVRICGRACVLRVVNDYGPSAKIRPPRIADLSAADFQVVCGPLSMGVCKVSAEIREAITLPATDTAP